jgi:hypothetical protein
VERAFSRDEFLTNVMISWVTGSIASSIRLYYERDREAWVLGPGERVEVPTGSARSRRNLAPAPGVRGTLLGPAPVDQDAARSALRRAGGARAAGRGRMRDLPPAAVSRARAVNQGPQPGASWPRLGVRGENERGAIKVRGRSSAARSTAACRTGRVRTRPALPQHQHRSRSACSKRQGKGGTPRRPDRRRGRTRPGCSSARSARNAPTRTPKVEVPSHAHRHTRAPSCQVCCRPRRVGWLSWSAYQKASSGG